MDLEHGAMKNHHHIPVRNYTVCYSCLLIYFGPQLRRNYRHYMILMIVFVVEMKKMEKGVL